MFDRRIAEVAATVSGRLDLALRDMPGEVGEAMRHATSGGKRLRAFLVCEGAALHGVAPGPALDAAAAIEAMHAYSLVHDDLPAMDDDDLRRGQPTVHVKWNEATAILVGDALQSLAFDLLSHAALPADRVVTLTAGMARAAGGMGMVHGQALDIAAETAPEPLSLPQITELQARKTGALIEWSAQAGPIMADADPGPMGAYARALGLAFQIADDILDVEGDEAETGKRLRKDTAAGKATFVSLMGLDGAKAEAGRLVETACEALSVYGERADGLREAARFVISRQS
ncbi:farnesyl diphosphate synthase [Pseudooceanicola batsensis HTCC2597]|uniref:Geranylgeranyl diphosphate synthase n=1 Tax=Pseudooceanicola batsensis (strain ATCC BAA-863 / DSM 15984 / KCTC 12145 / HTCC2597) TaxID=252305 RepID=A3TW96_PSEBH|nr:polyprenyl synthetase family protein [Pseudooceanicola batsensis]EAQ03892.1 farnesyl diphosphate synthase [Pseudooceanicola batsensis HTCC2597]